METGKIEDDKPQARIMIVDDDLDIDTVLKMGLEQAGIQVETFTDPKEAMEHFRAHSNEYCLALVDIRMPGISGFQLAREFHSINPDVKKVLMSAFEIHKSEVTVVLPTVKVDDFITKPFSVREAKTTILKHIATTKRTGQG